MLEMLEEGAGVEGCPIMTTMGLEDTVRLIFLL